VAGFVIGSLEPWFLLTELLKIKKDDVGGICSKIGKKKEMHEKLLLLPPPLPPPPPPPPPPPQ
jgi:hypothetical protein